MVFKVQKNPFLLLVAVVITLFPLSLTAFLLFRHSNPIVYLPLAVTFLLSTFLTLAIFRARFVVTEQELKVLFGWMTYRIQLDRIRYVRYTKNPLSAPAWTFRRIEIGFNAFDQIFVSLPKEEELFIHTLRTRCPKASIQGVEI